MVRFYAGLDVSDKTTHVCVVDVDGKVLWRGECATDPMALAATLTKHCRSVVLETGALSSFLYHGLIERGVPAVCVCARHAKGVLSARINKSDAHDAEGLAQMARTGWFKAVHIKDSAQLKVRELWRDNLDERRATIRMRIVSRSGTMIVAARHERKPFNLAERRSG